jgi:hypothetical protein
VEGSGVSADDAMSEIRSAAIADDSRRTVSGDHAMSIPRLLLLRRAPACGLLAAACATGLALASLMSGVHAQVLDADRDGIFDADERNYQTDPQNPDSDGDSLQDGFEVYEFGSSPALADTDNDLLPDYDEWVHGTAPRNPDTDGDTLWDGQEVGNGTDPKTPNVLPAPVPVDPAPVGRPDRDGDGLFDDDELGVYGTNPDVADSDGDGSFDGEEVYLGTDPRVVN